MLKVQVPAGLIFIFISAQLLALIEDFLERIGLRVLCARFGWYESTLSKVFRAKQNWKSAARFLCLQRKKVNESVNTVMHSPLDSCARY